MFLYGYAYVCFVFSILRNEAVEITDPLQIRTALDGFENNKGDIRDHSVFIRSEDSKQELCDNYFTSETLFYCDRCLPYITESSQKQIPCNFLIRLENKKKFQLAVRVDGGPKPFEVKVMDGLEKGYNVVDKVLTDRDSVLFESTGDMMVIRVDNRRANMSLLQFGFHVVPLNEAVARFYGCSFVMEQYISVISLPTAGPTDKTMGECYWKVPGLPAINHKMSMVLYPCTEDNSQCYLRYIRIFDGVGVKKIRLDTNETRTTKTKYVFNEKNLILEYYGCPVQITVHIIVE